MSGGETTGVLLAMAFPVLLNAGVCLHFWRRCRPPMNFLAFSYRVLNARAKYEAGASDDRASFDLPSVREARLWCVVSSVFSAVLVVPVVIHFLGLPSLPRVGWPDFR